MVRGRKTTVVHQDGDGPTSGHNSSGVSMDQGKYIFLKNQILEAKKANAVDKAKADQSKAVIKKSRKLFVAEGGSLAEFDFAQELLEMDSPDAARARLARLFQYLFFEDFALPSTLDTTNNLDPYAGVISTERERMAWFERGRIAARQDKGVHATVYPEGCAPECHQSWSAGVQKGYEDIMSNSKTMGPLFQKQLAEQAADVEGITPVTVDSGDDGDDDAPVDGEEPITDNVVPLH